MLSEGLLNTYHKPGHVQSCFRLENAAGAGLKHKCVKWKEFHFYWMFAFSRDNNIKIIPYINAKKYTHIISIHTIMFHFICWNMYFQK